MLSRAMSMCYVVFLIVMGGLVQYRIGHLEVHTRFGVCQLLFGIAGTFSRRLSIALD